MDAAPDPPRHDGGPGAPGLHVAAGGRAFVPGGSRRSARVHLRAGDRSLRGIPRPRYRMGAFERPSRPRAQRPGRGRGVEPELLSSNQRGILPQRPDLARGHRRARPHRRRSGGDPRGHLGRDPRGLPAGRLAARHRRTPREPGPAVGSDVPPERRPRNPLRQGRQPLRRAPRALRRAPRLLPDGMARIRRPVLAF